MESIELVVLVLFGGLALMCFMFNELDRILTNKEKPPKPNIPYWVDEYRTPNGVFMRKNEQESDKLGKVQTGKRKPDKVKKRKKSKVRKGLQES